MRVILAQNMALRVVRVVAVAVGYHPVSALIQFSQNLFNKSRVGRVTRKGRGGGVGFRNVFSPIQGF